jgi:YidC/Oxa1 family membrane protein insertase
VGIQIEGAGDLLKQSYITIGPGLMTPKKEEESSSMFGIGSRAMRVVMGKLDGSAERTDKPSEQTKIKWDDLSYIGIETLYFTALYSHSVEAGDANDPNRVILIDQIKNKLFDKTLEEQAMIVGLPVMAKSTDKLFIGPKEYILTKKLGYGELVDFGFWSFLAVPMLMFLKWIYGFVQNYGVAILLMTLVINLIFFPLRQKSYKSMAKMRDLQPKINAIKNKYEKYKKDMEKRQQMNQEIMTLYRSEGASPTGGCLPLLIQFPFLIAIYQMLANAIELRQAPFFLWLNDLSVKDPYLITPILMGLTMWYQNKLNPPASGGDQTMTKMMKFMPIVFTIMFLNFPSGLVIYWMFNNILAIGQQYLIKRNQEQAKALAKGKRRK